MKREYKEEKKQNGFDPWRSVAVASGAGFSLLTCMGIGVWSGIKCDEYLSVRIDFPFSSRCRGRIMVRYKADVGEIIKSDIRSDFS